MNTPVVFQSLEDELKPMMKYVRGNVLNAGCGHRDISPFLKKNGAASVENCDLASSIPGAIISDLVSIPRPDNTYDTILCNAVLEHVQFPDRVVDELNRVMKPDGHMLLCIPFMQPYHPRPDFRRFSREGMLELARLHDLEPLEILPVHTLAQTITWIWWSHLDEKNARLQKALLWIPFRLWGKFSHKTDYSLKHQSNSYQMVLRRPQANGNGNGHGGSKNGH
jgi:SAM-dependent methyltransferase